MNGSPDGTGDGFLIELFGYPPRVRTHLRVPYMHTYGYVAGATHYTCDDYNREIVFGLVPEINQNGEIGFVLGGDFYNNFSPVCDCNGPCEWGCEGLVRDNFKDSIAEQLTDVAPSLVGGGLGSVLRRVINNSGVYNTTTDIVEFLRITDGNITYIYRSRQ